MDVWCVKHREGWCALKTNHKPKEGVAEARTKCGQTITLPWGFEERTPTCPECLGQMPVVMPTYGDGFFRMHERMGADAAEALRQQVLKEQHIALAEAGTRLAQELRDRDTYKEYPPPRERRRLKKKSKPKA